MAGRLEDYIAEIRSSSTPKIDALYSDLVNTLILYFNGLTEFSWNSHKSKSTWERQKEVLDILVKGGQELVEEKISSSFQVSEKYNDLAQKIKTELVDHSEIILKYGSKKTRNDQWDIWEYNYDRMGELAREVSVDTIVPVSGKGFNVGFLAALAYGKGSDSIVPVKCSSSIRWKMLFKGAKKPHHAPNEYYEEKFGGKDILITDNRIKGGGTIKRVVNEVKKYDPKNIYVLTTKPPLKSLSYLDPVAWSGGVSVLKYNKL